MSRKLQTQKIDDLILCITVIQQNQCSPSEQDLNDLNEALERLQTLKRKKGKTNKQIHKEFELIGEALLRFFVNK
jgi:hypothetical protein